MDNTCPTCSNMLQYGDCGNCLIYCTFCDYHVGINGVYVSKDFDDEWIRNTDEYLNKEEMSN